MKRKLPLLVMSAVLMLGIGSFGLASCGENNGGDNPPIDEVVVTGVTIAKPSATTVFDGSTVKLTASVAPSSVSQKVTWTSSDETIATVTNGVVAFKTVTETKTVTIKAASKEDATKFDSVEFSVKHSSIDLVNSRGTLDTSLFMDEGSIKADMGDTALIYSDIKGTKWYAEANVTMEELSETDNYPKVGIMTSPRSDGYWNVQDEKKPNGFFYVDAMKSKESVGWADFNFVTSNDEMTDWNWGNQRGFYSVPSEDKLTLGGSIKMGLLRDGINYYLYQGKTTDTTLKCYKHLVWDGIAADVESYAWFGGWNVGVTVDSFVSLSGDAVNAKFGEVKSLEISDADLTLYLNETYTLGATLDIVNYDPSKLKFTSSDINVATVSPLGIITAGGAAGVCEIKVEYGELVKTCNLTVTDDINFKVELDGKMEDSIWSNAVKENKYTLKKNENNYIDFYVSRNSKGVYLFADYHVESVKGPSNDWWMNDNFELHFGTLTNPHLGDQRWASSNKKSNFDEAYISDLVKGKTDPNYSMSYECFQSYANIGGEETIGEDDVITFRAGSNPNVGWYNSSWFDSVDVADYLKITKDGFNKYLPTSVKCSEGHTFSEWKVTKAATCAADGEEERICKYCGEKETRVIAKGAHVCDLSKATVVTPSTCTEHGKGTCVCDVCGETVNVELPLDPENHSDKFSGEICNACHETLKAGVHFDYPNNSNVPGNFVLAVMNTSEDFEIVQKTNMVRLNGENLPDRAWAGQIRTENGEGNFDGQDANKWVFRSDWFGWGHYNSPNAGNLEAVNREGNCGGFSGASFEDYKNVILNDASITQTFTFNATTGVVDVVTFIQSNVNRDLVVTVTYSSIGFPLGKKLEIGVGVLDNCEATVDVNSVKINKGSVAEYRHPAEGAIGLRA